MAKSAGRPPKIRFPMAGEKLKRALGLLGKSCGINRKSQNHVFNWERWIESGLPKSITTIREDITAGIPEDRIRAYARCFQVSHRIIIDDEIGPEDSRFVDALLGEKRGSLSEEGLFGHLQQSEFSNHYQRYNTRDYLQRLFELVKGVYECYWASDEAPHQILRCALIIEKVGNWELLCRAAYHYYETDNHIRPFIFRWLNNLHVVSSADDYKSLFHAMFVDPLKIPSIMNTKPFSLLGLALSEDGEIGIRPMFSRLFISRISDSEIDPERIYEKKADEVLKEPLVPSDKPTYETLKTKLSNPSFY